MSVCVCVLVCVCDFINKLTYLFIYLIIKNN